MTPRIYHADATLCWQLVGDMVTLSCGDLVMLRAYRHRGGWRINWCGSYRSLVAICDKYRLPIMVRFQASQLDAEIKEAP